MSLKQFLVVFKNRSMIKGMGLVEHRMTMVTITKVIGLMIGKKERENKADHQGTFTKDSGKMVTLKDLER
jgi:hypothetical protein